MANRFEQADINEQHKQTYVSQYVAPPFEQILKRQQERQTVQDNASLLQGKLAEMTANVRDEDYFKKQDFFNSLNQEADAIIGTGQEMTSADIRKLQQLGGRAAGELNNGDMSRAVQNKLAKDRLDQQGAAAIAKGTASPELINALAQRESQYYSQASDEYDEDIARWNESDPATRGARPQPPVTGDYDAINKEDALEILLPLSTGWNKDGSSWGTSGIKYDAKGNTYVETKSGGKEFINESDVRNSMRDALSSDIDWNAYMDQQIEMGLIGEGAKEEAKRAAVEIMVEKIGFNKTNFKEDTRLVSKAGSGSPDDKPGNQFNVTKEVVLDMSALVEGVNGPPVDYRSLFVGALTGVTDPSTGNPYDTAKIKEMTDYIETGVVDGKPTNKTTEERLQGLIDGTDQYSNVLTNGMNESQKREIQKGYIAQQKQLQLKKDKENSQDYYLDQVLDDKDKIKYDEFSSQLNSRKATAEKNSGFKKGSYDTVQNLAEAIRGPGFFESNEVTRAGFALGQKQMLDELVKLKVIARPDKALATQALKELAPSVDVTDLDNIADNVRSKEVFDYMDSNGAFIENVRQKASDHYDNASTVFSGGADLYPSKYKAKSGQTFTKGEEKTAKEFLTATEKYVKSSAMLDIKSIDGKSLNDLLPKDPATRQVDQSSLEMSFVTGIDSEEMMILSFTKENGASDQLAYDSKGFTFQHNGEQVLKLRSDEDKANGYLTRAVTEKGVMRSLATDFAFVDDHFAIVTDEAGGANGKRIIWRKDDGEIVNLASTDGQEVKFISALMEASSILKTAQTAGEYSKLRKEYSNKMKNLNVYKELSQKVGL